MVMESLLWSSALGPMGLGVLKRRLRGVRLYLLGASRPHSPGKPPQVLTAMGDHPKPEELPALVRLVDADGEGLQCLGLCVNVCGKLGTARARHT